MKNRPSAAQPTPPFLDASLTRATPEGTVRYTGRFASRFVDGFFRETSLGLRASSLGIGTYLGDPTDADDRAYEQSIHAAVGAGINVIDTAINYRCQRSELNVGATLQRIFAEGTAARDALVVCTKGGYIPLDRAAPADRKAYQEYVDRTFIQPEILHPSEIVAGGHSIAPRFIRYCLAKSRQNLGVRTIDLYYVHNPEQQLGAVDRDEFEARLEAVFRVLEEAADRGEIGQYGIATWDGLRCAPESPGHLDLENLVEIARGIAGDSHHLKAVQLPINLAMPEGARVPTQRLRGRHVTILEAADELGLTVIASASLLQGRLSAGLPAAVSQAFPTLRTDAQRSAAFVRGLEGVSIGLIGMKQAEHLVENLDAVRRS